MKKKQTISLTQINIILVVVVGVLMLFNQYQIKMVVGATPGSTSVASTGEKDVSNVNIYELKSTAHSVAMLFPVEQIKTQQDAVTIMVPTGAPDYGQKAGVSYDDPIKGLSNLKIHYSTVQLTASEQQRYVSLVTKSVGISCEFCCGAGAVAVDKNGNSICGCQHNPALLGLTKWLIHNTDYTDAEIIREALRWKTLFFPKDMVNLAMQVAGKDISEIELPGMVGGC